MAEEIKLRKLLRTKSILEKGKRPFMVNSQDILPLKVKRVFEEKRHVVFEGENLDTGDTVKVTRSWLPPNIQDDPSRKIKEKIQNGSLILFQDVNENDLGLTSEIKACSRFSIISYGVDNSELHRDRSILVKESYTQKNGSSDSSLRKQKYFDINTNSSKKVNSARDALAKIKHALKYDGEKAKNTFVIRGFSPDENLAISMLFDDLDTGISNDTSLEKLLQNFLDDQKEHEVEIVTMEPSKKTMTGREILDLIDKTKDTATWEIIPARCYIKNLTPKNNVELEVKLNTQADIYEESYKYDNTVQGCINSTIGFLDKEGSNGTKFRNIVALFHDDQTPKPVALVETPFCYPAKELGFIHEEVDSTMMDESLPKGVDLVSYALSLDEDYSAEVKDDEISGDFDLIKQFQKTYDEHISTGLKEDIASTTIQGSDSSTTIVEQKDEFDEIIEAFSNDKIDSDFPEDISLNSLGNTSPENDNFDDFPDEIDLDALGAKIVAQKTVDSVGKLTKNEPEKSENNIINKAHEDSLTRDQISEIPKEIKEAIGTFMLRKLEKVEFGNNSVTMVFCDPISTSKLGKAARNFGISSSDVEVSGVHTYKFNSVKIDRKNMRNLAKDEPNSKEEENHNLDETRQFLENNFDSIASSLGM